jgi:hypothetical protein
MPQNKKAEKIAIKIMGAPINRETARDQERTTLQLKRETSTLVRS